MNTVLRALAGWLPALALSLISTAQVNQDPGLGVRLAIYEVPSMIVSRMFAGPDPRGGVSGVTVSGNTTSSFSEGVVLLQDMTPWNFSDSEIIEEISKFMATACIVPQHIDARLLACHDFQFRETLESREEARDLKARGVEYHYRLRLTPGDPCGDELPLKVEFWMNRNDHHQIQVIGEESVQAQLLDYTVGATIPRADLEDIPGRTLMIVAGPAAQPSPRSVLIGFASHDSRPRGTVYWLAVSADKL